MPPPHKKKGQHLDDLKQELEIDDHKIPLNQLLSRHQTNTETGLSPSQAKTNFERYGPNALTPPKTTPEWVKFCKNLFGGFSLLLWIGAVLCYIAYSIQV